VVELFTPSVAQCCICNFVSVTVFEFSLHPLRADIVTVNDVQSHWYRRCLETLASTHLVKTALALMKLWKFFVYFFARFPSVYIWNFQSLNFLQKKKIVSHATWYLSLPSHFSYFDNLNAFTLGVQIMKFPSCNLRTSLTIMSKDLFFSDVLPKNCSNCLKIYTSQCDAQKDEQCRREVFNLHSQSSLI